MHLDDHVQLGLPHRVWFTQDAFAPTNDVLARAFSGETARKVLVVADQGLVLAQPGLQQRIEAYWQAHADALPTLAGFRAVTGGEAAKNDLSNLEGLLGEINRLGIDRQSFVLAIGGGAMLDMVGFASAVAHRGVRLVRMPSTTLGQCDSGIGVKNGVNMFGKKNFIGAFAVPFAVVNDLSLLTTLSDRDWRAGLSEVVKVALLKDPGLFAATEQAKAALAERDASAADPLRQRSAELHYQHIVRGGDPFELTAARPLDFGHWAGHKLEQMTRFEVNHGEAVAIGLAIDMHYAAHAGLCDHAFARRVTDLLLALGFELWHEAMSRTDELLAGLEEFREHLGGELTITLVREPGEAIDVHSIDRDAMLRAVRACRPDAAPATQP